MQLHYLEIVTTDVDATCRALAVVHGTDFSGPDDDLGGARTATLSGGGRIGVRAPLHPSEDPRVRPYTRVNDLQAALDRAANAGAEIALPATEIEGQGLIGIVILGGVQYGFWQV